MSLLMEHPATFIDRRGNDSGLAGPVRERRQFADGHSGLSSEAQALANAVDQYKLMHRRRFITHEELLSVIKSLGYHQ
nr:hypothetical protein [uncultured bacterium]